MSKKFIRIMSIILCVITIISMFSIVPASAATQNTTTGQWVYTNVDDSKEHGLSGYLPGRFTHEYKINGNSGFCLNPHKKSPSGNMWVRYSEVDKNKYKNMVKALYCYKNGNITSADIKKAVTSQGISYSSSDEFTIIHYLLSWLYGADKNWNSQFKGTGIETAIKNLWTTISKKNVSIPDSFKCYTVSPQNDEYQTILIVPNNKLVITKTDSVSGKKLSGAQFHIYYSPDNKDSYKGKEVGRGVWTTGSDGTVTVWLPAGRYRIVEEKAPSGYQKSSEEKIATLSGSAGQKTVSFTIKNTPLIKLELTKQSSTSKLYNYEGAKYGVYTDSSCKNYLGWIVTDSNGYGYFGDSSDVSKGNGNIKYVPKKDYWLKELSAPKGYELDTKVYKFVDSGLTWSGYPRYVPNNTVGDKKGVVTDDPYIKLQLLKSSANCDLTDDNGMYSLKGAEYSIYTDKDCTKYFSYIVTDEDGYGCYGSSTNTNTDSKDKDNSAYKKPSGKSIALECGVTYYCKETKAPKGYDIDETVYQFKDCGSVSSDGIKIYRAYSIEDNSEPVDYPIDDPIGIVLQKRNAVTGETTGQGLEGAIFEVQYYAQEIDKDYNVDTSKGEVEPNLDEANLKRTWYFKTDEDGYADFTDNENYFIDNSTYDSDELYFNQIGLVTIPIGTVVIKEHQEPKGFTKSPIVFYRRITKELVDWAKDTNTPIEVPIDEQPAVGYIGIHKMNNSRQGIANAVYGLYATDKAEGTPLSTLTTDKDGNGIFDFSAPIGTTFYIKEMEAPVGYPLDNTIYPITATIENLTVETAVIQEIFEDSIKGDILIKKSSDDGIVKNLWFAVVDDMGNEYNPVVTDEKGEAAITGLPVYKSNGSKINYTIKELGFKVEKTTLSYGGYTWNIDLNKCIKYKNVYYEGVANDIYTSSNSKIPAYSRYYYGDTVTATKNQNGITQTLSENNSITYSFVNKIKYAAVEVNKKSFDNDVYRLFFSVSDQFGKSYGDIVTDSNGYASRSGLKAAIAISNSSVFIPINYKITELGFKNPGSGTYYLPDKYKETFTGAYQSCDAKTGKYTLVWNAYNEVDTGSINIEKSSDDGELENICFEISAWDDERDYGGDMETTYLGYDVNGNKIHRIVVKTDKNGKASSDSVQLYDCNGRKIDGLFVYMENLNDYEISYKVRELGYDNGNGTYTLPKRYVSNENDEYLYLTENRTATYTCVNTLKKGQLQIKKTSEDGIVSDLWFNIKSDYIDVDVSTDENGLTEIINNLDIYKHSVGKENELVTYTITELGVKVYDDNGVWTGSYQIPNRYKNPTVKTTTLSNDTSEIKIINFKNSLVTGNARLHKKDGSGKNLPGSTWELYRETTEGDGELVYLTKTGSNQYGIYSNNEISELNTDSSGELAIYNLPFGSYYFVEKTTPIGYMPYGEKIYFSIIADDETVSLSYDFTVKDNKQLLPNTGDIGVAPIYIIGGAVALAAVFNILIYFYFKKRKKKK